MSVSQRLCLVALNVSLQMTWSFISQTAQRENSYFFLVKKCKVSSFFSEFTINITTQTVSFLSSQEAERESSHG